MSYDEIVSILGYACDNDKAVKIITTDDQEIMGVPTTIDPAEDAHEVYLRPAGDEDTEIALSITGIAHIELLR
ncbi:MAG: hypothetical protein ACREL6_04060 [Gemmatimonadales bacterium]